ncbi:hypothetical protein [Sulfitobacter sp. SH24]|uniref:hypothetical protein n=1 Tax=Sulfitobacter sp. SH24 TaxID=3421173 RepID=UPI003F50635F
MENEMFEVPQPTTPRHHFAERYHQAVQHAAFLLGGKQSLRKAQIFLDDLCRGGPITRRMLQDAYMLQALIAEPSVCECKSKNAAGRIRPNAIDAYSVEIDLLAEAFEEALSQYQFRTSGNRKAVVKENPYA